MTEADHPSPAERTEIAARLRQVEAYGRPRRVWVDDGHVFVEGHDGTVVSMTPEVAIELGRLVGNAGAESLVNKVMDLSGGD
ncbi:stage III sporulation protein SpoIIIAA [Sphingomonas sp. UYAg733]